MSVWLEPLGLRGTLQIGTDQLLKARNDVPDWIGLLIWAGWWMRKTQVEGTRIFLVLLLPTRLCCSPLCALGALIGSIGEWQGTLTWEQFLGLPTGTKVFLRLPYSKSSLRSVAAEGVLGQELIHEGQTGRKITLLERKKASKRRKAFKGKKGKASSRVTLWVFESGFQKYAMSLSPHRLRKNLGEIYLFYKAIFPDLQSASMLFISNECLIVTNRAAWKREVRGILASTVEKSNQQKLYDLPYLLLPSEHDDLQCSGTLLCSIRSGTAGSENIPLAILDGPEALKCWEMVRAPNVIILLDQTEYDQSSESILASLSSARVDERLPAPDGVSENPPPGVEMIMFALESDEMLWRLQSN